MSKKSNNGYDSTIAEKANTPLASALRAFANNPSITQQLRAYLGVSLQAINQYKQGTAYPKTENLIKIAEFFGVSVDYLLGITDIPNRDTKLQSVHDVTGLSVGAIIKLHDLYHAEENEQTKSFIKIISLLLESENLEFLLAVLEGLFLCDIDEDGDAIIEIDLLGSNMRVKKRKQLESLLQINLIEEFYSVSSKYKELMKKEKKCMSSEAQKGE